MVPATDPVKIAGYRIEGVLGHGGMSRVYVARQLSLDRRVALKVFELGGSGGSQSALRLRREAHLLAKLDHENIVRCIDFGEADGYFYLALELVEGESLKQRLDRVGQLTGKDAARIAHAVGVALQAAHAKNVVHRDVKPGNVLLSRDGKVKLSDFGLARTPEDAEITQPGTALGTPQYLSPEQARSPRRANAQSDVYSLGATIYHMVAGVPPYQGDTLAEVITAILFDPVNPPEVLATDLDPGLSRIIARAMAKERTLRYRNALELNADLFRWLAGQADTTVGISWDEAGAPAKEPISRRTWLVGAIVSILVALVAALSWHFWRETEPLSPPPVVVKAVSIADVVSGRIAPVVAYSARAEAPGDAASLSQFEVELRAEVSRRVNDLVLAAESRAHTEVAAGRFDNVFFVFEREARGRVEGALGAPVEALPEEFATLYADSLSAARQRLDERLATTRARVEESAAAALSALVAEFDDHLAANRLESADRIIARISSEGPATVADRFERGVREALPDAKSAIPDPTWVERRVEEWRATASAAKQRLLARTRELIAAASSIVDGIELDPFDDTPSETIERELRARVSEALGAGAAETLSRVPEIEAAMKSRLLAFERARSERRERDRAEAESELASKLAEILARGDVGSALSTLEGVDRAAIGDAWLRTLALCADELALAHRAVLRDIEASKAKRIRVATRGVVREGVVREVDSARGIIHFVEPTFEVFVGDLSVDELKRRAGAAATPLVCTIQSLLSGDLDAAESGAAGHEDRPWYPGLRATLDEAKSARAAIERGEASVAERLLKEYDRLVAAGERGKAALIAEELLDSPGARRLDLVKARVSELERARRDGRVELEREKKRAKVRNGVHAKVEFGDDGTVSLKYGFDQAAELSDFVLPGPEWRIVDGKLSALSLLDRTDIGARIDLYRNRPGVTRSMPFESSSTKPVHVEFELILPLDPSPGLFGVRVSSVCFVIRTFAQPDTGGQLNAWIGELDQVRDYLFDPALGETRPRKSGGGWRPFALERGNRYFIEIDGPGDTGEWTLKVEDEVYRFRPEKPPQGNGIEIRSEMPCEIDDLLLRGFVAGVR